MRVSDIVLLAATKYSALDMKWASLLGATRTSDGKLVMLKRVSKSMHPYEAEIGQFFSSEPLSSHPRNHCVRITEILQDPEDDDT